MKREKWVSRISDQEMSLGNNIFVSFRIIYTLLWKILVSIIKMLTFPKTPLKGVILGGTTVSSLIDALLFWLLVALPTPLDDAEGVVARSQGESSDSNVSFPLSNRAILPGASGEKENRFNGNI